MNDKLHVQFDYFFDQQYETGISIQTHQKNFEEHTHDYIELVCQLQGDIEHIVNNHRFKVKNHQLIVIGQNDTHQNIEADSVSVIILLSEKYLNNILLESAFDRTVFDIKNYLATAAPVVISMNQQMIYLIQQLYDNYQSRSSAYYIRQRLLISQFLLEFEQQATDFRQQVPKNQNDVVTYIFKNIKNASLNDYAELVHYSPVTVGARIKKQYGVSFSELVKQIRLKMAADLLVQSDKSVELVMLEIGYNNKTYFYTNFKQTYNLSPANYRKKMLAK